MFTKWEWHGSLHRELAASMAIDLQVHGQQADAPLLLAEKFTLGGPSDLSAYDSASFSGDRGWALRAEVQRHLEWHRPAYVATQAQAYAFGATGKVILIEPTAAEQHSSTGSAAGLGIRTSNAHAGASFGPVELSGEISRQFNPVSSQLTAHWRGNIALSVHF